MGDPGHHERVIIVEDDKALRQILIDEVRDAGLEIREASSAEEAHGLLAAWSPDLVICDLRLPGADALELLAYCRTLDGRPGFLIITAFGSVSQAVQALKAGADDFLTKPLDLDHLMLSVSRILESRWLREEVRRIREIIGGESFHGMLGQSRPMRILFDQIRQVADASGPVLVVGESGVGKELVAHAIHRESGRSAGPFLAINCAAIPEPLIESELFGHTAGAFTGAAQARRGLFADASGGTLLLDEIAEMSLSLQAKLLRVLDEHKVKPLGSSREENMDVRVIAATNRDLESEVRAGRFREDLYYRLETFTLQIPPLRERDDDIALLAGCFLRRFTMQMGKETKGFSEETLQRLKAYPFPGNVRELQNAVECAVTFCQGGVVSLEHLPARIRRWSSSPRLAGDAELKMPTSLVGNEDLPTLAEIEARYVRCVLERVEGNKRQAASMLGIGRRTLYRYLGKSDDTDE